MLAGLRDLVEFLPASLAAIISYFSAEVTRGIWKQVAMNGIDWPSPAAILQSVESEIKEILNAVGVNVPSCGNLTPLIFVLFVWFVLIILFWCCSPSHTNRLTASDNDWFNLHTVILTLECLLPLCC